MDVRQSACGRLAHSLHAHFLKLLLASYVLASFWPGPGLAIGRIRLGDVKLGFATTTFTLPVIMLGLLLFNAGLGVRTAQLRELARRPGAWSLGLLANLVVPIGYILGVTCVMRLWHNPDEVQNILVGLALVASMPIAGSSTAWAQNAEGDVALSLGLVLGSTILSPFTTPLALHTVGLMATGGYAERLHELAGGRTGAFLGAAVIVPSLLGIATRQVLGAKLIEGLKPTLKLVNVLILLLLNYSNAAVSLPKAIAQPDFDFLAAILVIVVGLCVLAFAGGWALARVLRSSPGQRVSLMFGLGMNNNGTGLVLASMALADHPRVMIPIIGYNLVQHLVAGAADSAIRRPPSITTRPSDIPNPTPSLTGPLGWRPVSDAIENAPHSPTACPA